MMKTPTVEELEDVLCLVLDEVPDLSQLTSEQREAVFEWAAKEHLYAGDHDDVARIPMPDFL